MAKHTLKILRCSHRKIFKVCLAIFQHYEIKGSVQVSYQSKPEHIEYMYIITYIVYF